jgi:hypothetical protein
MLYKTLAIDTIIPKDENHMDVSAPIPELFDFALLGVT